MRYRCKYQKVSVHRLLVVPLPRGTGTVAVYDMLLSPNVPLYHKSSVDTRSRAITLESLLVGHTSTKPTKFQALALATAVIVSYGHWHVLAQPKWTLAHRQSGSAGLPMHGRSRGAGGSVFLFNCGKPGVATGASGRSDANE